MTHQVKYVIINRGLSAQTSVALTLVVTPPETTMAAKAPTFRDHEFKKYFKIAMQGIE